MIDGHLDTTGSAGHGNGGNAPKLLTPEKKNAILASLQIRRDEAAFHRLEQIKVEAEIKRLESALIAVGKPCPIWEQPELSTAEPLIVPSWLLPLSKWLHINLVRLVDNIGEAQRRKSRQTRT